MGHNGAVHGGSPPPQALAALCALLVVLLIVAVFAYRRSEHFHAPQWGGRAEGAGAPLQYVPLTAAGAVDGTLGTSEARARAAAQGPLLGDDYTLALGGRCDAPDTSPFWAFGRLYSTADVDPLVTGKLYEYTDGLRNVYASRTAMGDTRGLVEYSSSGSLGDVGVDVGPYGLAEYGGQEIGRDDGIPENWRFPSTPIRWYGEKQRDIYGPEGATVYAKGLSNPQTPDHDPLMA